MNNPHKTLETLMAKLCKADILVRKLQREVWQTYDLVNEARKEAKSPQKKG